MRILIDGWLLSSRHRHRSQGLQFRRLCQQIVWDDQAHEWFICVTSTDDVRQDDLSIEPYATVLTMSQEMIGHDPVDRDERYRLQVQQLVDQHEIDLYWHSDATTLEVPVPVGLEGTCVCLSLENTKEPSGWKTPKRAPLPPLAREVLELRLAALPDWADAIDSIGGVDPSMGTEPFVDTVDAAAYVAWFERCALPRVDSSERRLRVAYASPWAPQRTGVADYSESLTAKLADHVDLTVFTEADVSCDAPCESLPIRALNELPELYERFDAVIYHVGNNVEFHKAIYKLAWELPGVVVIHDTNIHSFMSGAFLHADEPEMFYEAVEQGYGIRREECDPEQLDMYEYPLCRAIAARSKATIVHNRWARQHLNGIDPVYVIPHGAASELRTCDAGLMARLRKRLGVGPHEFVIVTMGYVNRLKRVPVIVQAVDELRKLGYPVRLVIGGSITDQQDWLVQQVAELGLEDAVTVTGYLSDDEFDGVIQLSDVVLNLRFPSMGESSGTLYKAMARGKACIVSNYGQFAELPDDACWKINPDELEVPELVAALAELLRDSGLSHTLGENAKHYVQRFSSYELSARLYTQVLAETIAASGAGGKANSRRSAA